MKEVIRYTIFKTKWGYFGLAAGKNGLLRTRLPIAGHQKAKYQLLKTLPQAKYDKKLFKSLQQKITAYFEGSYVDFHKNIPIILEGKTAFQKCVLSTCQTVSYGQTTSYGGLAKKAGFPNAGRAVGAVMANNSLPLIIPCHRVICSNNSLGGFSAIGGVGLKKRMLKLERKVFGNL